MEAYDSPENDALSHQVIGVAIKVHRTLGPWLLESAYEACLCHELGVLRLNFARQVPLAIDYEGVHLDCGYRLDVVVESRLLLELKAIEKVLPIHEAQLMTYLKLARLPVGLLINFNVEVLTKGITRRACTRIKSLPKS